MVDSYAKVFGKGLPRWDYLFESSGNVMNSSLRSKDEAEKRHKGRVVEVLEIGSFTVKKGQDFDIVF